MAYRFTNTDKWGDAWFSDLRASAKLLFLYFCDYCDAAGFLEINVKKISFDCGLSKKEVEDSLGQLNSKLLLSPDGKYLFIRNFIKHQKNLPLNENNNAHLGIIRRLNENLQSFGFEYFNDFLISPSLAPDKPLSRGSGKGNSNSNSNSNNLNTTVDSSTTREEEIKTWRDDFEVYLTDLREAYKALVIDTAYITERAKYHPGINIKLSLEKSCKEFWATEAGWKHKKKSKSNDLNWKSTFTKTLDQKCNQVWLQKGETNKTESNGECIIIK